MKIIHCALAAILALAVSAAAIGQSSTSGPWASNPLPQVAYAGLPSASSVASGARFVATDLGANGTELVSNGTRWRTVNGEANLAALGAPTGNIANTETIVLQTRIPSGAWQVNDTLRIWLTASKSGTTDAANVSVRVGTAGTIADTAVMVISGAVAASAVSYGALFDLKLTSTTAVSRIGSISFNGGGAYGGTSSTALPAAVTITDASANALYVTVTLVSGGTTNTVAAQSAQIQLVTP